jgi:hypothetical protein
MRLLRQIAARQRGEPHDQRKVLAARTEPRLLPEVGKPRCDRTVGQGKAARLLGDCHTAPTQILAQPRRQRLNVRGQLAQLDPAIPNDN